MKTFRIYIIGLFIFLVGLSSCQEIVSPNDINHSQKIKSSTKWLIDNNSNTKLQKVNFSEYDINGKIIINEDYNETGELSSRSLIAYTSNKSIESTIIYNNGLEIDSSKTFSNFNDKGLIIKTERYNSIGKLVYEKEYHYDHIGNITSILNKNIGSDSILTDINYSYNTNGELIERVVFNNEESFSRDSLYYLPSSNKLKIFHFDDKNSLVSYNILKYNDYGNVLEEIIYNSKDSVIKKYLYEYTYFH